MASGAFEPPDYKCDIVNSATYVSLHAVIFYLNLSLDWTLGLGNLTLVGFLVAFFSFSGFSFDIEYKGKAGV